MNMVIVIEKKVLHTVLSFLREENTKSSDFRRMLRLAGFLMMADILSVECRWEKVKIKTCFGEATGVKIKQTPVLITVMRAAMPFVEGALDLLDQLGIERKVGVVDAKRKEEEGMKDYKMDVELASFKVPPVEKNDVVFIFDVMVATGSTLIEILKRLGRRNAIVCSIISSKRGVENVEREFRGVRIYTLAVDAKLNRRGYIVPGLGDAGDRAFGT